MILLGVLAFTVLVVELLYYTLAIPDLAQRPLKAHTFERYAGRTAYALAYALSLLRAPLGLVPYLVKLCIFFVLRIDYESSRSTYIREVINMAGDIGNLGLTLWLVFVVVGFPHLLPPTFLYYIPLGAELTRIVLERVPILFSAIWQLLPHRRVARSVLLRQRSSLFWSKVGQCFSRYCCYYSLSDIDRTKYLLCSLKQRATFDRDVSNRLEYISAFRIVSQHYGLRGGRVRDVASGEVFIHAIWTNDPWLLAGMALRRAPWMFDPRYLRRPFYYMTEANRLATLFALEHARYCPPYAVFQFAHEIRVARLHFFYGLLRWSGLDVEEKVLADGTFQFDQFIYWLDRRFRHDTVSSKHRYLYTDDETVTDLLCNRRPGEELTVEEIATRYTYPLKYVNEVLIQKILASAVI